MNAVSLAVNLQAARKRLRCSRADLANKAGVSEATIARIERGVLPRIETIAAIAAALSVSIDALLRPRAKVAVRFRALKSISVARRAQRLELVRETIETLLDVVPELAEQRPMLSPLAIGSPAEAAAVALEFRDKLGGSRDDRVDDVVKFVESLGFPVLLKHVDDRSLFGMSIRFDSGAVALVANTAVTVERLRHTILHEFAHVLFHSGVTSHEVTDEVASEEAEADAFAGEFLAPTESVRRLWSTASGDYFSRLLTVKQKFGISCAAVMKRIGAGQEGWLTVQAAHRARYGRTMRKVDEPEALSRVLPSAPFIHRRLRAAFQSARVTADFVYRALGEDALRFVRQNGDELTLSPGPSALPDCGRRGADLADDLEAETT